MGSGGQALVCDAQAPDTFPGIWQVSGQNDRMSKRMIEVLGAPGGLAGGPTCRLVTFMVRGERVSRGPFPCAVSMAWRVVRCREAHWFSDDGSEARL